MKRQLALLIAGLLFGCTTAAPVKVTMQSLDYERLTYRFVNEIYAHQTGQIVSDGSMQSEEQSSLLINWSQGRVKSTQALINPNQGLSNVPLVMPLDDNSITWINSNSLGADLEVRVRTASCDDSRITLLSSSLGPREKEDMSCHNHEGVCYRWRNPENTSNPTWSDWYGVGCHGQTMKLPAR